MPNWLLIDQLDERSYAMAAIEEEIRAVVYEKSYSMHGLGR